MNYVGIDWAYGRAAFCAMGEGGEVAAEGLIPANEDGLGRLSRCRQIPPKPARTA